MDLLAAGGHRQCQDQHSAKRVFPKIDSKRLLKENNISKHIPKLFRTLFLPLFTSLHGSKAFPLQFPKENTGEPFFDLFLGSHPFPPIYDIKLFQLDAGRTPFRRTRQGLSPKPSGLVVPRLKPVSIEANGATGGLRGGTSARLLGGPGEPVGLRLLLHQVLHHVMPAPIDLVGEAVSADVSPGGDRAGEWLSSEESIGICHKITWTYIFRFSYSQTLHVWYIYLHWGGLRGQCRHIWHTWSVWNC